MQETLTVLGFFVLAVALRTARRGWLRKLGAMTFLVASYFLGRYVTGSIWGGMAGVVLWFFLPWVELLTRIRRMRLPLNNRLRHRNLPDPAFFPNAVEAATAMEEAGFEHVADCGWEWSGMQQFFRLFWHPEEMAVAAVCLCEQSEVAFAFISVTSHDESGRTWRTTNYPFSPTLKCAPGVRWNHVPCERNCFHQILDDHRLYLARVGVTSGILRMPDPERIEDQIEQEMRSQVEFNLNAGIIRLTGDGHFEYSRRGLVFLWGQFVKDMLRLC